MEQIQKLPETFRKYGYDFKLVKRSEKAAIYSQAIKDVVFAYEVIKIRKLIRQMLPSGVTIPAKEAFPSTSDWGKHGWTVRTLERALAKFQELEDESNKR